MKKKKFLVGFIVALLLGSLVIVGCKPSPKSLAKQYYDLEQKIEKLEDQDDEKNEKKIEELQSKIEELEEKIDNLSEKDQEIVEMEYMRLSGIK